MEIVKVGLVVVAGLGSTWMARAATEAVLGVPPPRQYLQAPEPGAGGAPAAAKPAMPELSREEMDKEFREAQAQMSGGDKDAELREFRPTRPLPADLPIALPSDI